MKLARRQFLHLAAGPAALPAVSRIASAQTYPTRPITIIVPYAPGGATDLGARVLSGPLAATLGHIVENVSGGNALIGTGRVARASPDGYTLLVHNMAIAANVSLFPKSSFNVEKVLAGHICPGCDPEAGFGTAERGVTACPKRAESHQKFRTNRLRCLFRTRADDCGSQFLPASGDRALGPSGTHKPHRGGTVTLAGQLTRR